MELRELVQRPPPHLLLAAAISHRKCLVTELAKENPHHIHLVERGGTTKTLEEWLSAPIAPRPLALLREENHARFRLISATRKPAST